MYGWQNNVTAVALIIFHPPAFQRVRIRKDIFPYKIIPLNGRTKRRRRQYLIYYKPSRVPAQPVGGRVKWTALYKTRRYICNIVIIFIYYDNVCPGSFSVSLSLTISFSLSDPLSLFVLNARARAPAERRTSRSNNNYYHNIIIIILYSDRTI